MRRKGKVTLEEKKCEFPAQENGWQSYTYTMTGIQANLWGILAALPFLLLTGGLYRAFLIKRAVLLGNIPIVLAVILLVSLPLHEGLHGLGWKLAGKTGKGEILFFISQGMPMCTCRKALPVGQYLMGILLPFLMLGMGSILLLIIYPGTFFVLTAFVNLTISGADLVIAGMLLQSGSTLAVDCPDQAGFIGWRRRD